MWKGTAFRGCGSRGELPVWKVVPGGVPARGGVGEVRGKIDNKIISRII